MVLKIFSTSSVYLVTLAYPFVNLAPYLVALVAVLVLVWLSRAVPINASPHTRPAFCSCEEALTDDWTTQAHIVSGLGAFLVRLVPVEEYIIVGT